MCSPTRLPLIVLIGPTGVGKTEYSIQLAARLNGEIISADSRLFYRGMDIGTAKPGSDERARVPHHLIDIAEPDEFWSLGRFLGAVRVLVEEIHQRGNLPMLVGGTGQYVMAVVEGWQIPAVKPDPDLRQALENWALQVGSGGLHERLAVLDPEAARKIDLKNVRRTIRALEVILSTGVKFSSQRRRSKPPFRTLMLGLSRPRAELYQRIDERIDRMIASGLIEEVRSLIEKGYPSDLPTFSAIGYRQIIEYLDGGITLDGAIARMKRATRNYVRRQANWFKADDPNIEWFDIGPDTLALIEASIHHFLSFEESY